MSYRPRRRSLVASQRRYHQGFRPLAPNHPAPRPEPLVQTGVETVSSLLIAVRR